MSEKEKRIMETLSEAFPKMSDFDKGYLLGSAERMVSEKEAKTEDSEEDKETTDKKTG